MFTTDNPAALTLEPIGFVRTSLGSKVEAPRQPTAAKGAHGRIELLPGRNFEHALEDLEGWEFIWVVFWFQLNASWRPKVLPPRSVSGRKGVFSTRSPHRPNPIGLSAVRLERVEGLTLQVSGVDMLDGTPVLDIKPYVPYTDSHPGARCGWLEETGRSASEGLPADPVSGYAISFDAMAEQQAGWIEARTGLALRERIRATLELGPQPHPYRRIRREGNGLLLSVKEWRVRFSVDGRDVRVTSIVSGYRQAQLAAPDRSGDTLLAAHREFVATWPHPGSPDPRHPAGR